MRPRLYLLIGAPGAGKTTTAQIIAKRSGAVHIWADVERHKLFPHPSHTEEESNMLYEKLNKDTEQLLAAGASVVFDTNFNFYRDRQLLTRIARQHQADTVVIWLTTPEDIARSRAVGTHHTRNGYSMHMTDAQFEAIVAKLEPPRSDENIIKLDGTNLDEANVVAQLHL